MNQDEFLCESVGMSLSNHRKKPVIIHNEHSGNSDIGVVFSLSGMSIRDRIVVSMHDVDVTEWQSHENVMVGDLNEMYVDGRTIRIIAGESEVTVKFSHNSTLKINAMGTALPSTKRR